MPPLQPRKAWKFVFTPGLDGYSNMVMDAELLERYTQDPRRLPVFRIYTWKDPFYTLGHSQDPQQELDTALCEQHGIGFVKRITGGGIIYHDHEITYSMVCSRNDLPGHSLVAESFKHICSFLLHFYRRLGLQPRFAADIPGAAGFSAGLSSFCFAGREKYDILIDNKKIGGNAQKRTREVIFQHGSIPLKVDLAAAGRFLKKKLSVDVPATVCGLEDLLGRKLDRMECCQLLKESFRGGFGVDLVED